MVLTYLVPVAVMTSFPAQAAPGVLSLKGIAVALAMSALFSGLSRLAWRWRAGTLRLRFQLTPVLLRNHSRLS